MKKLFCLIIYVVLFLLFPKQSFAVSEFKTDYNVNYDVGVDGITSVTEKITLTNLTETYYASTFVLSIGSPALSDVTATDGGGNMEVAVEVKNNQTVVSLRPNEQITGVDKKQNYILKYKSNDFATQFGKNWEINLPRVHEGVDVNIFNLNLSVPMSFGEPTSIAPKPKSESDSLGKLTLNFTKEQLLGSGVSVNFGSTQVFDFNIKYSLKNTSFLPVVSSISLPMDTNYQDVLINSITPVPLNVTIDRDGNYLAWYQLQKRSELQITASGSAKLYINPKKNAFKLSQDQISSFTKSDKFWEKDSPTIKAVLLEIYKNGEPKTTGEKARLLYQYVVTTLEYNLNKLPDQPRLGALTVISNTDKAQSQEFVDLFVTLARASGIPARALDGFAYSQNQNLRPTLTNSHVWVEYFDDSIGWVMVDPTWANTSGGVDYFNKLDLNHLVLNIRGNSSISSKADINISANISEGEFRSGFGPDVEIGINDSLWAGLPGTIKIKIINNGTSLLSTDNVNVTASNLNILNSKNIPVSSIPPYGFTSFDVDFRTPFLAQETSDKIIVDYMGQIFQKQISIKPLILFQHFPYFFVFLVTLIFGIYLSILGIHVHKKYRKKSK